MIFYVLLEEYRPFVMQTYDKLESPTLYDVEALLFIQKVQLDKFKQELSVSVSVV